MRPVFKFLLSLLLFLAVFAIYAKSLLLRHWIFLEKQSVAGPLRLKNILDASPQPDTISGKNIFFIESHKNENKTFNLTARQACSIESAGKSSSFPFLLGNQIFDSFLAFTNPDKNVFVLFSYEVQDTNWNGVIEALRLYKNVHFYELDILQYSKDSPLETWFKSGKIFDSQFIVQHVSDILRILTLWKYSGTYFDLDVIVKKPIKVTNFACIQNDGLINSAIVNLDKDLGRSIAERNFKEVINHFNGGSWTGNGPTVLSDILKNICNTTDQTLMTRDRCEGFRVYPKEECYAIGYGSWQKFFDEKSMSEVAEATKNSFAVHFWNYLSGREKLKTSSHAPYLEIARKFCPHVVSKCGEDF